MAPKLLDPALLRTSAHVAGSWISADSRATYPVRDPATGAELARVPRLGVAEARRAVEAAEAAQPAWRAEQGRRVHGETIPAHRRHVRVVVTKQPIGVGAAITPWNFPAAMITRKKGEWPRARGLARGHRRVARNEMSLLGRARRMNTRFVSAALAGCLFLIACGGEESQPAATAPAAAPAATAPAPVPAQPAPAAAVPAPAANPDAAAGATLYAANCATCHGARGAGDGPAAAALVPKPARHGDGSYMNGLGNEHLFKVVKEGGTAVGKSALMAPWGGMLSDAQIWDLVAFMRTLADPPYTGSVP